MDTLFGRRTKLERAEQALGRGNFAEALLLAEEAENRTEDSRRETVIRAAADGLARLNLEEGERILAAGDLQRGQEHLQLALEQARSEDLRAAIAGQLAAGPAQELPAESPAERRTASACGGCGSVVPSEEAPELPPDLESQFELILLAYPEPLQHRYREHSADFQRGLLLANQGEDRAALEMWQSLAEAEWDALYLFELGSLYGRLGELSRGIELLQRSLAQEPQNLLALDALVELMLADQRFDAVQELLDAQREAGFARSYCHARLCELCVGRQETEGALEHARRALAEGYADPHFLILAARLLEQAGDQAGAERLLTGLPGGGCGGGINLHLAEFWLRQKRDLGKVLDAFNGACRLEPDNPRWQLRVAQTYLARDWKKQGLELLRKVVQDPRLDESLRLEAESQLMRLSGSHA